MKPQSALTDLIGRPFVYGGRGPDEFDCWGLVQECWRRWHNQELPDYRSSSAVEENARLMEQESKKLWTRLNAPRPGSVLLLRVHGFGAHVGFVHTTTRFLQAIEKQGVVESRMDAFRRLIIGAYDYAGA